MENGLQAYLNAVVPEARELLKALCAIPAPSHFEDARAEFVKSWLEQQGAKGVYIDEAKNVLFPMNCDGREDIVCFAAHTDTVFPMETPLDFHEDGESFCCPGVGDDTVCLVQMLLVIRYLLKNGIKPSCGVLFAANACEEGLGNLKGVRQIFAEYAGRIRRFYTFDGQYSHVVTRCVGSHRYRVTAKTVGGHSYGAFGNPNAIAELSRLITKLYAMEIPQKENTRTTFNVGTVEGGTSVNTIAQNASMLFEYRSDDAECLGEMQTQFKAAVEAARGEGKAEFEVEVVGLRPCGGEIDETLHKEMTCRVIEVCEKHSGIPCAASGGSTDCNIPMSLGVPAVCVGTYLGAGAHTREESVLISSVPVGLRIAAELILDYFDA